MYPLLAGGKFLLTQPWAGEKRQGYWRSRGSIFITKQRKW